MSCVWHTLASISICLMKLKDNYCLLKLLRVFRVFIYDEYSVDPVFHVHTNYCRNTSIFHYKL